MNEEKTQPPMEKVGMICSFCGSSNLEKRGDSWHCQDCGMKQSYIDINLQPT